MEDFEEILEHAEGNQPIPQPAGLENVEHPPHDTSPAVEDDETDTIEPIQPKNVAGEETSGRGK